MKKDCAKIVQYLFKSMWKSYNFCSFLDKNSHADFYSVLNVCDFCTIENLDYTNRSKCVQLLYNFKIDLNSGYRNRSIYIQF